MYGLFGLANNVRSIYKISAPFASGPVATMRDLKPAYLGFLKRLHKTFPINDGRDLIINNRRTAASLVPAFSGSVINDLEQEQMVSALYSEEDFNFRSDMLQTHLNILKDLNPEVSELFHLAIHSILLAGSGSNKAGLKAHGGSSNSCIGLIWLTLKPELSTQDILEMCIHELTHTLVFVDELNYGHFHYDSMSKIENWATSSILKRKRPMDKVIHSIVVSTEILLARKNYLPNKDSLNVHPESAILRAATLDAIESVFSHPRLNQICRQRAVELVGACRDKIL